MKNNKDIIYLIENGLHIKTLSKMNESQIKVLVEKFKKSKEETKEEVKQTVTNVTYDPNNAADQKALAQKGLHIDPTSKKITMSQNATGEIAETETDDLTTSNAQGNAQLSKITGQEPPEDANDMAPDGMDDDSDDNRSSMGLSEKFVSHAQQNFFWAKCNTTKGVQRQKWCQLAREFSYETTKKDYKKMPEKLHPEKTVKVKKEKTNEQLEKFLEKKISEMVEKEIQPKMCKKDLIEAIKKRKNENSMILRKPKKMEMFSDEAPMELPIGKMFSIGKTK